jgi:hypothetical protein
MIGHSLPSAAGAATNVSNSVPTAIIIVTPPGLSVQATAGLNVAGEILAVE